MSSEGSTNVTVSKYAFEEKFHKDGSSTRIWVGHKDGPQTTSYEFSGKDNIGIFGSTVQNSLRNDGVFPLVSNATRNNANSPNWNPNMSSNEAFANLTIRATQKGINGNSYSMSTGKQLNWTDFRKNSATYFINLLSKTLE